jgi:hypothetical protein
MTVHAYFCFDSDSKDKVVREEVEVVDEARIHIDKYHGPDVVNVLDNFSVGIVKHIGVYEFAMSSGPINAPVLSILNNPGQPEFTEKIVVEDTFRIEVNGVQIIP